MHTCVLVDFVIVQDELSECRKRLQEYINENTDLREELEDRVSQLQLAVGSSYDNPATPGMSLLNEMNGFRSVRRNRYRTFASPPPSTPCT